MTLSLYDDLRTFLTNWVISLKEIEETNPGAKPVAKDAKDSNKKTNRGSDIMVHTTSAIKDQFARAPIL